MLASYCAKGAGGDTWDAYHALAFNRDQIQVLDTGNRFDPSMAITIIRHNEGSRVIWVECIFDA